jgi:hypothetical protein
VRRIPRSGIGPGIPSDQRSLLLLAMSCTRHLSVCSGHSTPRAATLTTTAPWPSFGSSVVTPPSCETRSETNSTDSSGTPGWPHGWRAFVLFSISGYRRFVSVSRASSHECRPVPRVHRRTGRTDYKTGQPEPHHVDQLRLYALLWQYDEDLNSGGVAATSLSIVYAAHDEVLDAPTAAELHDLASTLDARIEAAESQLRLRPPPARPAPEICRYCSVRHMCEEYWADIAPLSVGDVGSDPVLADCEGTIARRNGPRSWVLALAPTGFEVLLRTPTEEPGFEAGDRVRLLGVVYGADDDAERTIATITQASEVFLLTG